MTIPGIDFEIPTNVVILGTDHRTHLRPDRRRPHAVYRTTRVLNFAAGEMGALPAVLIPILVINNGWPYWLALPLALLGSMLLGGVHRGVRHPPDVARPAAHDAGRHDRAGPGRSSGSTC